MFQENDDIPIPAHYPQKSLKFAHLLNELKDLLEEPAFMQVWQEEQSHLTASLERIRLEQQEQLLAFIRQELQSQNISEESFASELNMSWQKLAESLRHADKSLVLYYALSLHLDADKTRKMLSILHETLCEDSLTDRIVLYYLQKSAYTVDEINHALDYFNQEMLSPVQG